VKRLGILILSLTGSLAAAQSRITTKDDFTQNSLGWWEGDRENYSCHVRNGKLRVTTHYESKGAYFFITVSVDPARYYSLSASFTQRSGDDNNGMGLTWGKGDQHDFVFSSNGYYKIDTNVEGQGLNEWFRTSAVKGIGETNVLRVEKTGSQLSYYINNNMVATSQLLPWDEKNVGVVTYTKMELDIDDFSFTRDLDIRLPPDMKSGLVKENLGQRINSEVNELSPKISADGKTLYFQRKHHEQNIGGTDDPEDVWFSHSRDGYVWEPAQNMGRPVNTERVNALSSVSPDENLLLFGDNNGFRILRRTAGGWSEPEDLGIRYTNEDEYLESCMSPDGKAIFFTAMLKNNINYREDVEERDIYVCVKNAKGQWSMPLNLGRSVNTPEEEYSPFMSADGRTLYFASVGWPGYGDADIFMTRRLDDTYQKWSDPVNLGPGINSEDFDAYYTLPASGEYAYMASSYHSLGEADIIRIALPREVRPDPVVLVRGKVLNARTKQPLKADIRFENLATAKEAGEAWSDPRDGNYRIVLPYGINYGLRAQAPGYLSVNENLELAALNVYKEVEKDLYLVPIEVGEVIQLKNVFFKQGQPVLLPESYPELDRLTELMNVNPRIEIELDGHTDNQGNFQANMTLSQQRVDRVKLYLVDHGISGKRITGKGYGPTKPVAPNDKEENRRLNRRVEFRITKK
jgi:outer membrane protein OmpA-like peptidoglycan-associated protein